MVITEVCVNLAELFGERGPDGNRAFAVFKRRGVIVIYIMVAVYNEYLDARFFFKLFKALCKSLVTLVFAVSCKVARNNDIFKAFILGGFFESGKSRIKNAFFVDILFVAAFGKCFKRGCIRHIFLRIIVNVGHNAEFKLIACGRRRYS